MGTATNSPTPALTAASRRLPQESRSLLPALQVGALQMGRQSWMSLGLRWGWRMSSRRLWPGSHHRTRTRNENLRMCIIHIVYIHDNCKTFTHMKSFDQRGSSMSLDLL